MLLVKYPQFGSNLADIQAVIFTHGLVILLKPSFIIGKIMDILQKHIFVAVYRFVYLLSGLLIIVKITHVAS